MFNRRMWKRHQKDKLTDTRNPQSMDSRMGIISFWRLNKGFILKFLESYQLQQIPEENEDVQLLKWYDYKNNQDEVTSLSTSVYSNDNLSSWKSGNVVVIKNNHDKDTSPSTSGDNNDNLSFRLI